MSRVTPPTDPVNNVFVHAPEPEEIETGELFMVCHVVAANVARDLIETLRNLLGGRMRHYSDLLSQGMEEATRQLRERACAAGYEGVVGFRMESPSIVEGGIGIVVYGNGFRYRNRGRKFGIDSEVQRHGPDD